MSLIYVQAVTYTPIPVLSSNDVFHKWFVLFKCTTSAQQQQQHLFKHDKITAELMRSCI